MRTPYYREQALEGIAREVITAYDPNLYYVVPRMIPIEDIIEAQGITLEYQCLRKTGCVLGETIFDDGGAIIYDYDIPGYTVIAVKGGTILIDSSLCREDASTGRLRFTCAHELAHWLLTVQRNRRECSHDDRNKHRQNAEQRIGNAGESAGVHSSDAAAPSKAMLLPAPTWQGPSAISRGYGRHFSSLQASHAYPAGESSSAVKKF